MKILILGGGHQQVPAIRKAKEMELETIVADYLEHPLGMDEADQFYRISTRDREEILALARREDVDGILSYASDPAAATAAYAAGQLGLPGGYTEAAEVLGHKGSFRRFLSEHGIPVPGCAYLTTGDVQATESLQRAEDLHGKEPILEWSAIPTTNVRWNVAALLKPDGSLQCTDKTKGEDSGREIVQSILIKPADSSGSKGITVLHNPNQIKLMEAYRRALSVAYRGDVLAEEYIPYGYRNLIGGDVIVRNSEIVCLGLMDCVREQDHPLVPCGKIWPCGAGDAVRNRIAEIVTLTVHELHISDAEMNVEFIVRDDGRVYPIEIALRCGGNGIPQLLSDATGVDWVREEVRRTLRGRQQDNRDVPGKKDAVQQDGFEHNNLDADRIYATYNLHANANGLYAGYELAEELARHCYREELFCRNGDEVKPYADASGIIGILYFRFESREQAERYLYDMSRYLQIHLITITRIPNAAKRTVSALTTATDSFPSEPAAFSKESAVSQITGGHPAADGNTHIHDEILRLGEHMTPPFSQRDKTGWNSNEYAGKLTANAEIFTARHSSGETVGLIAAYMNQQDSAFISMLVVAPQYRRYQIAQTMCQHVHELARRKGIRCIRGEIRRDNTACRTMAVKRLGYTLSDIEGSEFVRAEKML